MADERIQVVFASAEASPFVKTGGLGDVAGSLPAALSRAGADVIVMVPKYGSIAAEYLDAMEHLDDFYVPLGWRNEYCGLERLDLDGVTYLFVDNERYFKRDSPYGFFDDGERFAFFSKAVTESLQHLPEGFSCDILHCNDWHTALALVFLREFYQGLPLYDRVRTVFSIHNIAFQGQFSDRVLNDILGLAHIPAAAGQLRCDATSINYMQGALHYADAITTVSPSYAEEIRSPAFGENLDSVLRKRSDILSGILNGIDVDTFDPAHDRRIPAAFDERDMAGKRECKAALQQELGLEIREDRPLMIMVTRLTRQKGLDLVTYSLERILSGGVQVAVLGTGDRTYEDALNFFASLYPGVMATRIQFNPALSHRMYAGADMLLMPSLFEPCGLSQMIAMRYGTLPIVRETGGLKDTVTPYNRFTGEGTGFSFAHFNGDEMGDSVFRAARLFWDDRDTWRRLVARAMHEDFSWVHSAGSYLKLYRKLRPLPTASDEEEGAGPKAGPADELRRDGAGNAMPDVVPAIPVKRLDGQSKRATRPAQSAPDAPDKASSVSNARSTAREGSAAAKKPLKKVCETSGASHSGQDPVNAAATKRVPRPTRVSKTTSPAPKQVTGTAASAKSPTDGTARRTPLNTTSEDGSAAVVEPKRKTRRKTAKKVGPKVEKTTGPAPKQRRRASGAAKSATLPETMRKAAPGTPSSTDAGSSAPGEAVGRRPQKSRATDGTISSARKEKGGSDPAPSSPRPTGAPGAAEGRRPEQRSS